MGRLRGAGQFPSDICPPADVSRVRAHARIKSGGVRDGLDRAWMVPDNVPWRMIHFQGVCVSTLTKDARCAPPAKPAAGTRLIHASAGTDDCSGANEGDVSCDVFEEATEKNDRR